MSKMTNTSKIITAALVVILAVFLIVHFMPSGTPNSVPLPGGTTTSVTAQGQVPTTTNSPASNTTVAPKPNPPATKPNPAPTIHFITPVAGDNWTIAAQNPIQWSAAGDITGSISLLDANTKAFVGTILPQIGPAQTSYTWNTRDIFLDRSNPLKKNVVPGTYVIQVSFDGNNLQPITSPVFTITQ